MSDVISQIEAEQMGREVPEFVPGDTVVVKVKVREGTRERLQAFEGVVIAKRNRGLNSAFTVRKMSHGEGVERVIYDLNPVASVLFSLAQRFFRSGNQVPGIHFFVNRDTTNSRRQG